MNKLHTEHNAGYPFDIGFLAFMQNAYNLFNHFGHLAGNLAIISGCKEVGNTITPGTVYINGELLPFEGGTKDDTVWIREDTTQVTFKDGFSRTLETIRTVVFGYSSPDKTFNWADFKRVNNLQELYENKAEKQSLKELKAEVEILKKQKQAIPVGLIAIWGKPANQIPEGWREYTDLRGRMPVGLDPYYHKTNDDAQDYQLNSLLKQGGERSHKLTVAEMPSHNHQLPYRETQDDQGFGSDSNEFSIGEAHKRTTTNTGGDQPHNNMPPYHVVQFIEYVGFQVAP
nr:MAG TPA: Baseplate structural protein [Caudoviricetes sp.]